MSALYQPSPWGLQFHALDHQEALGAGAAGVGKTRALIMDPLSQIIVEHQRSTGKRVPDQYTGDQKDNWRIRPGMSKGWALHLRRTMPMLKQSIVWASRVFHALDPAVRYEASDFTFVFASGYRFQFGHCAELYDYERYLGTEYTHIGFDELVMFEQEQYEQIRTRCRTDDPILSLMRKVRAMSNPMMNRKEPGADKVIVSNPMWVRDYFVEPAKQGKVTLRKKIVMSDGSVEWWRRVYWPGRLSDNPNALFRREYELSLRNERAHIRQALLEGNWYVTVGSYYADDWLENIHVCEPFDIPDDWHQFRTMDWGFKQPGCILWWAMSPEEVLYCTGELVFQGKLDREVAKMIREREIARKLWHGGRSRIQGYADTQLWEKRGDSGMTKEEVMAQEGVMWLQADKDSRARNAQLFTARLRDHRDGTRAPGIIFFSTCDRTIKTVPTIQADPSMPEIPQDGGYDHPHDAVLYGCAAASRGRKGLTKPRRIDGVGRALWERPPPAATNDRGRWGYGSN